MDLVGPRPERPCFIAWLASEIPTYRERLLVLPGVTGLAQVNLPPDEELDCVRKKIVLDCEYITSATLGMDVRLVLCSMLRMFGIRHGRAVRWLRLERQGVMLTDPRGEVEELLNGWSSEPTEHSAQVSFVSENDNGFAIAAISNGNITQNGKAFEAHSALANQRLRQSPR
jgi:hypothetical protein